MKRKKRKDVVLAVAVDGRAVVVEKMPEASAEWLADFINARSRLLGDGPRAVSIPAARKVS